MSSTDSNHTNLQHKFARVPRDKKIQALATLLRQPDVTIAIVFCETKTEAAWVYQRLKREGFNIGVITGDIPQEKRLATLQAFRDGGLNIVVATDVAARGLDFPLVSHVFHFTVPRETATYVHRSGRTARAGHPGIAFTLVTPEEDRDFQRIMRDIKQNQPAGGLASGIGGDEKKKAAPKNEQRPQRKAPADDSGSNSLPKEAVVISLPSNAKGGEVLLQRNRRLLEGEIIGGNFKLVQRVGQGTFGVVYRAEEIRGGRSTVAVKLFYDEPDGQEMAVLASVEHPHILRYRATLEHEGQLCLVTDFADGGDALQTLQAFPQGIPWQQVSRILRQLTEALAYLHERNIAHRDVKSANILFVNGRACLGDVGLAKALTRTRSSHDGTHSIAYAAPEMFRDQVHLKSDVYSLGITTYELLTGQLPFTGSPAAVMFHHLQSEPDLARVQNETAKEVLGRMLQKDPSDRISAAELLAILPST